MTLDELIARVEAATEGSASLDLEIGTVTGRGYFEQPALGIYTFSRSMGAAMTLIPGGYWWTIGKGRTRPDEPLYGAQLFDGEDLVSEAEHEASIALAIVLACLKGRRA